MTTQSSTGARLGGNYRKLLLATALSNMADGIRLVALPWLTASITRDPIAVAGVAAAAQLPWLVASVPAGVFADRFDRRALIVGAQLGQLLVALSLALLTWTGGVTVAALMALAILAGCAEVVADTGQTLLPAVVQRSQVVRANGYLVGAEITTQTLIGRPVGGLLASISVGAAFVAQSVLAAAAAVALMSIPGRALRRGRRAGQAPLPIIRELVDGLRWLWRHRLLRDIGVIVAVSNIAYGATTAILVLFAREVLGVGAAGFGLIGGCLAGGGVLGSLVAAPIAARLGERGTFLLVIFATAAAFAAIGISSHPVVAASMLTVVAGGFTVWEVVWRGMRIRLVPDRLLGRVTSVLRWLEMGPFPVASLLGGLMVATGSVLADRELGLRLPYLLTAVSFVLLGIALYPIASPSRFRAAEAAQDG